MEDREAVADRGVTPDDGIEAEIDEKPRDSATESAELGPLAPVLLRLRAFRRWIGPDKETALESTYECHNCGSHFESGEVVTEVQCEMCNSDEVSTAKEESP